MIYRIILKWPRTPIVPAFEHIGRILFFLILLLFALTEVEAIDISATGGWGETIDASDLVSGAGSNLVDTYESTSDATTITISNCKNNNDNWSVRVHRLDDSSWHNDLIVYVKRTSDGQGGGSISGGLDYVFVLTIGQALFFSGKGDRSNIAVQYKVTGMSVDVSPATYNTTVVFTVVDT